MIKQYGYKRNIENCGLDRLSEDGTEWLEDHVIHPLLNTDFIQESCSYEDCLLELDLWINKNIKVTHIMNDDGFYCNYTSNVINMEDECFIKNYIHKGSLINIAQRALGSKGLRFISDYRANHSLTNRRG
jgi:hypothetical protein